MVYKTRLPTGRETGVALATAWVGLAANGALLGCYLFGPPAPVTGGALMVVGACVFILIFSSRLDEHFNALRDAGLKWGMAVIALYLSASAMVVVYNGGHSLGSLAAGGTPSDLAGTGSGLSIDGFLLAILAALAFHLGFATARIRGTRGA